MIIDQISIFVENDPGKLAKVTRILGEAGVDIRAMSIADTRDFGILRTIVSNPKHAAEVLELADYVILVTQVFAIAIEDRPGSLADVLDVLSEANISVEYLYAFITRKENDAYVILRVEETEEAERALTEKGIRMMSSHELYGQ